MEITSPLLYLSSAGLGWEGLHAQAFHEPAELEGWVEEAIPDVAIVLFRGGAMRLEQRQRNGSWKAYRVEHGNLLLRPSGKVPAEVRWKCLSQTPTQTLHLHVSTDLISRTAQEVAKYSPRYITLESRSSLQDPLLQQIGYALWHELEHPTSAGKLYAQTATQMLAVHLLHFYAKIGETIGEPTQGLTSRQLSRIKDFIQACLDQDLSLDALAQQVGFSPYHFTRLFRKATGESPHQFVLRQRVEHAQRLLVETDMPLADVAHVSGFANQSHLTRIFKQHYGMTPRVYRQDYTISAHF